MPQSGQEGQYNCYISLFKTKTHHPCRQTRIFSKSPKVLSAVNFIFQINSTWRRAHKKVDSPRGLPPEGRPKSYIIVLREVSLAAMIFNGGLITLPPVPLRDKDLRLQNLA